MTPTMLDLPSYELMKTRISQQMPKITKPSPKKAKRRGLLLPAWPPRAVMPSMSVNRRLRPSGFFSDTKRTLRPAHWPVYPPWAVSTHKQLFHSTFHLRSDVKRSVAVFLCCSEDQPLGMKLIWGNYEICSITRGWDHFHIGYLGLHDGDSAYQYNPEPHRAAIKLWPNRYPFLSR